jgi:diguanylate cyclase (GGDEF)-like protein
MWKLAEEICAASRPLTDMELSPTTIAWEGTSVPIRTTETQTTSRGDGFNLKCPMVIGGELVGCLGIRIARNTMSEADARTMLQIVATQLGTSLRNAHILAHAQSQALTDELTGAYNRRYLKRALDAEWRRAQRYGLPLSIAILDIDHFKRINDDLGHLVGDKVIVNLVKLITSELRDSDYVVRYGGEEFLILLPQTGPSEAVLVLERIRTKVANATILQDPNRGDVKITVSSGISALGNSGADSPEHMIELADQALYDSKRHGRNVVTLSSGRQPSTESVTGHERRRFPRVEADQIVSFVQASANVVHLDTTDISAGGLAVRGIDSQLEVGSLAIVQHGETEKPMLCRVVWTRAGDDGENFAGLRYVDIRDLAAMPRPVRRDRRALVLCDQPEVRAQVQRVLRAAHCESDVVTDNDASNFLDPANMGRYSLIVLGESKLRDSIGHLLRDFRRDPEVRIVVINEHGDRKGALSTIHAERLEHYVPSPAAEESLFATLTKLLLGEYFGIKKYLMWGAATSTWRLENSADKERALTGIVSLATEVACHPRIVDQLVQAVDEMIINALFRASPGMTSQRPVTVECGSDGRLLAVSVIDEHGMLDNHDIFDGIGAALTTEAKGVPAGATHAHLGFRIMLDALSQLSVNIDPGRCTEIIGIVDLRRSLREHRTAVPGLGLFRLGR